MRGRSTSQAAARTDSVWFASTGETEYLVVGLVGGSAVVVPLDNYPTLKAASTTKRRRWKLIAAGQGVSWPELDLDLSTEGLVAGNPEATTKARSRLSASAANRMARAALADGARPSRVPALARLLADSMSPAALRSLARSIGHVSKAS